MYTDKARVGKFGIPRAFISKFFSPSGPVLNGPPTLTVGGVTLKRGDTVGTYVDYESVGEPPIGSCRITFSCRSGNTDVSIIAEQTGQQRSISGAPTYGIQTHSVTGYGICFPGTNLGSVWLCANGRSTVDEMVRAEQSGETVKVCCVRVIGYILLMIGWASIFSPITTLLGAVPFLGAFANAGIGLVALVVACCCASSIIAVAYFAVHPILTAIAVGLLTAFFFVAHAIAANMHVEAAVAAAASPAAASASFF